MVDFHPRRPPEPPFPTELTHLERNRPPNDLEQSRRFRLLLASIQNPAQQTRDFGVLARVDFLALLERAP